jgi:NADH-quinone oxidoreductase subunit M
MSVDTVSAVAETLLPVAIAAPLCASILLIAVGTWLHNRLQTALALAGVAVPLCAALFVWTNFATLADPKTGLAAATTLPFGIAPIGVALTLGVDGLSLPLFVLAALVGTAAIFQALQNIVVDRRHAYLGLILFMLAGALGMFATTDLFFLYFFHEFALIPSFILILFWGGVGRRTAAIQMAVYLTIGAMLVLAGLALLALKSAGASGALTFNILELRAALAAHPLDAGVANWVFGLLLFGFGILVSLFPFHSWAPAAYTEAPTPVSMLHAGVLKKFGLYGLLQIAVPLAPAGFQRWAPVLFLLAVCNIVVIGIVTIGQRHLKEMISYSSVAHMGPIFIAIYALSLAGGGVTGAAGATGAAVFLMFGHGLTVAALFALSRSVSRRTRSLEFIDNGGLARRTPVLAAFFAAAMFASVGLPGFANFWGELGTFVAIGKLPVWEIALVASGIVFSAVYMLRAFARIFLGEESESVKNAVANHHGSDISLGERITVGLLLAVLLAVGLYPRLLT